MANLKHVGRVKNNKRKVIVAYRVIPGDPENCLCVTTENLSADEHDSLIKAVESDSGQSAYEFAEAMARTTLPDGRNMLAGFHTTGKMVKLPTNSIEMTPNNNTVILLSELNSVIAQQKGVTVNDLAIKSPTGATAPLKKAPAVDPVSVYNETTAPNADAGVLTDEALAAQLRSQADALFKEAKALREQAEELVPTKKKKAVESVKEES